MTTAIGTTSKTITIPNTPGHPNLEIRIIVSPLRNKLNLTSITPKSLDNRFVIFPSYEDLMIYAVSFDTLPYKRIIRAAFILVAII